MHHLTCLPVLRRARLLFTRSEASMSSYGSRARLSTLSQLSTLTRLPQHGPSLASALSLCPAAVTPSLLALSCTLILLFSLTSLLIYVRFCPCQLSIFWRSSKILYVQKLKKISLDKHPPIFTPTKHPLDPINTPPNELL